MELINENYWLNNNDKVFTPVELALFKPDEAFIIITTKKGSNKSRSNENFSAGVVSIKDFITSLGSLPKLLKQDNLLTEVNVPVGETWITFGSIPIISTITGDYVNITGAEDVIMTFNSLGYPQQSHPEAKVYQADGRNHSKTFNPTGPIAPLNGDWWFEEDLLGNTHLVRKNNFDGTIQKVQLT